MQNYKKIVLSLFLSLCSTWAIADENTFTINITGPDEQSANAQTDNRSAQQRTTRTNVAPRQRVVHERIAPIAQATQAVRAPQTPAQNLRQQNVQAPNNASLNVATPLDSAQAKKDDTKALEFTKYAVKAQDTIWSIASRFTPISGEVNEFQVLASIYRHNPDAFVNNNINQLRRVTLNIPPISEIAKESTEQGSLLLQKGTITLNALHQDQDIVPESVKNTTTVVDDKLLSKIEKALDSNDKEITIDNNKAPGFEIPKYVARETQMKELKRAIDLNQKTFYGDDDGSLGDSQGSTLNAQNDPANSLEDKSKYKDAKPLDAKDLDISAVKELLANTQEQFVKQSEKLDKKIDMSVLRAETVAKSSASSIAKEEVVKVLSHYEGVIANLQQSNAELRASISKFNKQVDQIRAISITNADKLTELETQYIGMTESSDESIPQGPLMWILLGVGILSLSLAIVFFILKSKNKKNEDNSDDYMTDDDLASEQLLTTGIVNKEEIEKAQEEANNTQKEEENSKESVEDTKTQESTESSNDDVKDNASEKAQDHDNADQGHYEDQLIVPNNLDGDDDPHDEDDSDSIMQQEAQKAWDEAAQEKDKKDESSEDDVMAAWNEALNEENDKSSVVDIKDDVKDDIKDDIDNTKAKEVELAASWAKALDEQEDSANQNDEKSADEALADAWAKTLDERAADEASQSKKDSALDADNSGSASAETIKAADDEIVLSKLDDLKDSDDEMSHDERELASKMASLSTKDQNELSNLIDDNKADDASLDETYKDDLDSIIDAKSNNASLDPKDTQAELDALSSNANSFDTKDIDNSSLNSQEADVNTDTTATLDTNVDTQVNEDLDAHIDTDEDLDTLSSATNESYESDDLKEFEKAFNNTDDSVELSDEAKALQNAMTDTKDDVKVIGDNIDFSSILDDATKQSLDAKNIDVIQDLTDKVDDNNALDAQDLKHSVDDININHQDTSVDTVIEKSSDLEKSSLDEAKLDTIEVDKDLADTLDHKKDNLDESLNEESKIQDSQEPADKSKSFDDYVLNNANNTQDKVSWEIPDNDFDITASKDPIKIENDIDLSQISGNEDESMLTNMLSASTDDENVSLNKSQAQDLSDKDLSNMLSDVDHNDDILDNIKELSKDNKNESLDVNTSLISDEDLTNMLSDNEHEKDPLTSSEIESLDLNNDSFDNTKDETNSNLNENDIKDEDTKASYPMSNDSDNINISSKLHQKLTDELNLAQLFFETGDTDEALSIVDKVREQGSPDLVQIADDLKSRYADN